MLSFLSADTLLYCCLLIQESGVSYVKKVLSSHSKGKKRNCVDSEAQQILIKCCYTISFRPLYLLNLSFH